MSTLIEMCEIAIITEQGRRPAMEDAADVARLGDGRCEFFIGVYDGHGGSFAAEYASAHLRAEFVREFEGAVEPEEAFTNAYEKISAGLRGEESGTVALTCYLRNTALYHANAGDARLIVATKRHVLELSVDHRLENPEERRRIAASGGLIVPPYVVKQGRSLMPTRSLGDEFFKDVGVIARPSVGRYRLASEDRWVVAGTDGLFDYMRSDEIVELLSVHKTAARAAYVLREEVLDARRGMDNLTFVLLKRCMQ